MFAILLVLISILLFIFWVIQFCSLMQMGDEEFKTKNDKLIWALAMLFASFLGAFLFWVCKKPHFDDSVIKNTDITSEEAKILSGCMDRYKTLMELFPEYLEIFVDTISMQKWDREEIEKLYIKHSTEKLIGKFHEGPDNIKKGIYGILIAELIRREIDISKI